MNLKSSLIPQSFTICLALYKTLSEVGISSLEFYFIFLKRALIAFSHLSALPIQDFAEAEAHILTK